MSDNGSAFFYANKPARNGAFDVPNQGAADGDTSVSQTTAVGNDRNRLSHIQPAGPVNRGGLPGEQEDPRLC